MKQVYYNQEGPFKTCGAFIAFLPNTVSGYLFKFMLLFHYCFFYFQEGVSLISLHPKRGDVGIDIVACVYYLSPKFVSRTQIKTVNILSASAHEKKSLISRKS
jgi:hypothetical protein